MLDNNNNNNNTGNAASGAMTTSLAGMAYGLASTGMNQYLTDKNRESDFENYKEAQQMNYQMAQNMQQTSPMNTKYGMMAAGLNPASMQTSSSPASMNSAPLASTSTAPVNFAQDNNLMADAKLKNAEAEKVELQNEQTKGENESSLENYVKQMETLATAYENQGWNGQADSIREDLDVIARKKADGTLNWNVGHLKGALNAFTGAQQTQERLSNMIDQFITTEKNYKMLNNKTAEHLAEMPRLQKDLLSENIAVQIAQRAYLMSGVDVNSEQINTLQKQQKKMDGEIALMVQQGKLSKAQAESIRNADWKTLFGDGEILRGMAAFGDDYTKEILHSAGALIGAYTFGKGAKNVVQGLNKLNKNVEVDTQQSPIIQPHKGAVHKKTRYSNGVPREEYDFDDYSY